MGRTWGDAPRKRSAPPERRAYRPNLSGRQAEVKRPNLRPIEQTIIVLMARAPRWTVVDEFNGHTGMASGVRQALWRRGFQVLQRQHPNSPDIVQVWARWTWPKPSEVANGDDVDGERKYRL